MTVVRMLMDMQGSRHDGQPWPGYYGEIEVPEWEAEQLVRGGNAELTDKPKLDRGYDVLKVRETTDVDSQLRMADGSDRDQDDEFDDDFESDDDDAEDWDDDDFDRDDEEVVTPQVNEPSVQDKKAVWIDYAVSRGANRAEASELTKNQLVAEYKGK